MKEYTLITGASSGIGYEMARYLAEKNENLILVARRKAKLLEIQSALMNKHKIEVAIFDADLSETGNAIKLFDWIHQNGYSIRTLINNAGFGDYGPFDKSSLPRNLDMIALNTSSLVALTHLFLEDAKKAGRGRILNVASILSFFPYPYLSVYAATKAFVLSFTESIREELSGTGITVSALCPGPTETEFASKEMLRSNSYQGLKQMDATKVARAGIDALYKDKAIIIPGFLNKMITASPRFTPRSIMRRITKHLGSTGD